MDSRDDRHALALALARHQRIDPPHAHCTCDPHGEEVVRIGQLFSKHLVEVVQEAGWVPPEQHQEALDAVALQVTYTEEGTYEVLRRFRETRGERDALAATVERVRALVELPDPHNPDPSYRHYAVPLGDHIEMGVLVDDLRRALDSEEAADG